MTVSFWWFLYVKHFIHDKAVSVIPLGLYGLLQCWVKYFFKVFEAKVQVFALLSKVFKIHVVHKKTDIT